MSLKDQALKVTVMQAMAGVVKDATEEQRKELLRLLLAQFEETGAKSLVVKDLHEDKIATVTLTESKPSTRVTDQSAFLAWCETYRPDLVDTIVYEPVAGWTETRLTGNAADVVAAEYGKAGDLYVTPEGEPVDGVEYVPAPAPSKFSVTYPARDRGLSVVQAWRDGALPIELDANLPRVGA